MDRFHRYYNASTLRCECLDGYYDARDPDEKKRTYYEGQTYWLCARCDFTCQTCVGPDPN